MTRITWMMLVITVWCVVSSYGQFSNDDDNSGFKVVSLRTHISFTDEGAKTAVVNETLSVTFDRKINQVKRVITLPQCDKQWLSSIQFSQVSSPDDPTIHLAGKDQATVSRNEETKQLVLPLTMRFQSRSEKMTIHLVYFVSNWICTNGSDNVVFWQAVPDEMVDLDPKKAIVVFRLPWHNVTGKVDLLQIPRFSRTVGGTFQGSSNPWVAIMRFPRQVETGNCNFLDCSPSELDGWVLAILIIGIALACIFFFLLLYHRVERFHICVNQLLDFSDDSSGDTVEKFVADAHDDGQVAPKFFIRTARTQIIEHRGNGMMTTRSIQETPSPVKRKKTPSSANKTPTTSPNSGLTIDEVSPARRKLNFNHQQDIETQSNHEEEPRGSLGAGLGPSLKTLPVVRPLGPPGLFPVSPASSSSSPGTLKISTTINLGAIPDPET